MFASRRLRSVLLVSVALGATAGCRFGPASNAPLGPADAAAVGGLSARAAAAPQIAIGGLTSDELRQPTLVYDAQTHGYMAVWQQKQGDRTRAYAVRLGADFFTRQAPLRPEARMALSPVDGDQAEPALGQAAQGFLAAWTEKRPDAAGVHARWIERTGEFQGAPFRVGGAAGQTPAVSDAAAGDAMLIAWEDDGRIQAVPARVGGLEPGVTIAARGGALGFLGGFLGAGPQRPVVAAAPAEGRFLVTWSDNGTLRARLVNAAGGMGEAQAIGAGQEAGLAYDPGNRRFMAAFARNGHVLSRSLGLDGQLGAEVDLGAGAEPAASYDPVAKGFVVAWRSDRALVTQRLSPTLELQGPAGLLLNEGRALTLTYDAKAQRPVLACEERAFSFDRLTVLPLR